MPVGAVAEIDRGRVKQGRGRGRIQNILCTRTGEAVTVIIAIIITTTTIAVRWIKKFYADEKKKKKKKKNMDDDDGKLCFATRN